jgi:hypothetical protein
VPWQVEERPAALEALGVFGSVAVGNDAWALLRLGAAGAPAVGVVCGAGLKCVARTGVPVHEFPSLGWQAGDLSGAGDFLARTGPWSWAAACSPTRRAASWPRSARRRRTWRRSSP